MEEHKLLTGMLLVALVVSVVGTVITVDRLGAIGGVGSLTGAVTAGGTGDLNITTDITITLADSVIDFGNGVVDASAGYASVNSGSGTTTDGTWANTSDNITVRNDGNVGVNITVQSNKKAGNDTTDSFICQNDVGGCGADYPDPGDETEYKFDTANEESDSCTILGAETSFDAKNTEYEFCDCLKTGSTEDEVMLSLLIGIPADAQGHKDSTITFTSTEAASAGQC